MIYKMAWDEQMGYKGLKNHATLGIVRGRGPRLQAWEGSKRSGDVFQAPIFPQMGELIMDKKKETTEAISCMRS